MRHEFYRKKFKLPLIFLFNKSYKSCSNLKFKHASRQTLRDLHHYFRAVERGRKYQCQSANQTNFRRREISLTQSICLRDLTQLKGTAHESCMIIFCVERIAQDGGFYYIGVSRYSFQLSGCKYCHDSHVWEKPLHVCLPSWTGTGGERSSGTQIWNETSNILSQLLALSNVKAAEWYLSCSGEEHIS